MTRPKRVLWVVEWENKEWVGVCFRSRYKARKYLKGAIKNHWEWARLRASGRVRAYVPREER